MPIRRSKISASVGSSRRASRVSARRVEAQRYAAQIDGVAWAQGRFHYRAVADACTVSAPQVPQRECVAGTVDLRMVARDPRIGQHHVVVQLSAKADATGTDADASAIGELEPGPGRALTSRRRDRLERQYRRP